MAEASAPMTRLRATADAEGWTKFTVSPLPMEKLCQLTMALSLVWLTVVVAPLAVMAALPLTTVPPVGLAQAVL
ncbi:hypothetical protein SAMN04490355_103220 [Pelosinus propionicus DSM 13327]|uniref:Uncharacterized protein n=1 Tax=Pelosinus propionicus DSM 13327 TaxID=1123291 RepID=A0A1I4MBV5_9FIRM|nr:hypothetical protein SAMN04490355_103220 [Pelosinus propionicus DSM 13327]